MKLKRQFWKPYGLQLNVLQQVQRLFDTTISSSGIGSLVGAIILLAIYTS